EGEPLARLSDASVGHCWRRELARSAGGLCRFHSRTLATNTNHAYEFFSLALEFFDARYGRCALYTPRSLGSSLSWTASPRRFDAKTTRLMAVPGKRTIHGAF